MNAILRSWAPRAAAATAVFGLLAGCNDDKTLAADAGTVDAATPKPVLDGKLGEAAAAVEATARPSSSAKPGEGPPENGIFAPGMADKAHAANTPATVEVLGEGSDPKIQLALAPAAETQVLVTTGVRVGPQASVPPIDFALSIKLDKPKSDKDKKDDKPAAKPGPLNAVIKVTGAGIGGAQLPKEVADQLGKLKGSEIRLALNPDGTLGDYGYTLGKDTDATLDIFVRSLAESLALLVVPLPPKPVGVGGYWMTTDRASTFGMDVVRYRVYHVQKIEAGKATLAVDVRQYSVKDELDLTALAKGQKITTDRFESQGKGTIAWASGSVIAPGSEIGERVQAMFGGVKNGQAKAFQIELSARTSEAEKADRKK
jgi:hypothetical protein